MANKQNKTSNKYKEDILFFRMSMLFIAACAAIITIFKLNGTSAALDFWRLSRNPLYIAAVVVLLVLSLVYVFICKKNKKDESEKTFSSLNIFSVVAYVFFASIYWGFSPKTNAWVLLASTICLVLLYFIYNIYKKDFFVFSVSNLLFIAALWFFSFDGLWAKIIAGIVLAISAYACFYAYKFGKNEKMCVFPVYVSFIISVLLVVGKYFIALPFASSSLVATIMIFQYLIFGIFYTIRLIREA